MTFKKRLKEVIGAESIRSFSMRAGASPSSISRMLSGQNEPSMTALIGISNAAGVTIDWLATAKGIKYTRDLLHIKGAAKLADQMPDQSPQSELQSIAHRLITLSKAQKN